MDRGIYLIIQFNFPKPFKPEDGAKARILHDAVEGQDWITEVFAADGGVGAGPASIWVFRLDNYAALDRLLGGEDPVSKAYVAFYAAMDNVADFIREEILFG